MSITLRQLEVLALVVKHGSFRKCAEELNVSPVSISEHIRELEQRLQSKIFVRTPGHAVTLTDPGKIAYSKAKNILDEFNSLIDTFTPPAINEDKISLFLQPFLATTLIGAIKEFRQQCPEVHLNIEYLTETPSKISEKIASQTIDLAFCHTFEQTLQANAEKVAEDRMAIFVAKDHPLTKLKTVSRADLAAYPSINLLPGNPLRELTDQVMAAANLSNPHIGIETDEYGLIVKSLAEGMGFTCMFLSNIYTQNTAEKLTCLPLNFDLPTLKVHALTSPLRRDSAVVARLRQKLINTYQALQQQTNALP